MRSEAQPVEAQEPRITVRDLLRIHDFRMLWLGQIVSNFGDAMTSLAILILVNQLTGGSTTALAIAAIVQAVPRMTIGLVAGVYVDRLDRRHIMIVSDVLRGFLVLGLIFVDSPDRIWLLYVIGFLVASVSSFFMPARMAYIPLIVPDRALLAANSLGQTTLIITGVLGAGAAGWLVGSQESYELVFSLDALTFMTSALFIKRAITPSGGKASGDGSARAILTEMLDGFRVMGSSRILIGVLVGMAVTMLGLGMVNILMVPLVVNELGLAETWFAALQLAQSASMVLSGALLTVLAARFVPTHIASVALVGAGICVGLVAAASSVWGLIFILFCVGWFVTPLQASLVTLLQDNVRDEMRGRAGAALSTAAQTASVVSMAAAGLLADAIGARGVFVLGGGFTVLAGIISAVIFRGQVSGALAAPEVEEGDG